ncbi:TPA: hypothetical protein ACF3I9_004444 [Klebsiella aerogenes]
MKLDKAARILCDFDSSTVQQLDDIRDIRKVSRNHIIRTAVDEYLQTNSTVTTRAFGLWHHFELPGLKDGE